MPGISLDKKTDKNDQMYTTPKNAIELGADILIIGRSIILNGDILSKCKEYQRIGWENYTKKHLYF